jgi:hypothetical protein
MATDDDDDDEPKSKKAKVVDKVKDEDDAEEVVQVKHNDQDEAFFELSEMRRVTIRKFKGTTLVDIREVRMQCMGLGDDFIARFVFLWLSIGFCRRLTTATVVLPPPALRFAVLRRR